MDDHLSLPTTDTPRGHIHVDATGIVGLPPIRSYNERDRRQAPWLPYTPRHSPAPVLKRWKALNFASPESKSSPFWNRVACRSKKFKSWSPFPASRNQLSGS